VQVPKAGTTGGRAAKGKGKGPKGPERKGAVVFTECEYGEPKSCMVQGTAGNAWLEAAMYTHTATGDVVLYYHATGDY